MQVPLEQLRNALGPNGVLDGDAAAGRSEGWSRLGTPLAILRPTNTSEVSTAIRLCAQARVPVVPWGGKTGLVEGALADGACALSLERMQRIQQIDAANCTMTVQAGCILQQVCEAAEAADLLFPLDLGARGSATIGGVISTNAGGNRVVRFGMMRELVLGLEAVLADGTVVSSLYPFIKNNTGYDLKQLFIGSEGTLGVVTQAVLRLRPRLQSQNVAFASLASFADVIKALRRLEARLGGQLSAFEVMWSTFYELVTTAPANGRSVLEPGQPYYVLIESLGGNTEHDEAAFEAALAELLEQNVLRDVAIARSKSECDAIWALRDDAGQVRRLGPLVAFDVSFILSRIEAFDRELRKILSEHWPQAVPVLFGHVGDGNIHVNVCNVDPSPQTRAALCAAVYHLVHAMGGCISAEHGIGLDKRPYLSLSRTPEELALMRLLKSALDPCNILNPGKVLEQPV